LRIAGSGLALALALALTLVAPAILAAGVRTAVPPRVLESTVDGGRFGPIHVYRPAQRISGVALFFSGDGGWNGGVIDHARRLAGEGYLVGGVDVRNYLESIRPKPAAQPQGAADVESCVSFAVDVEGLGQHLQRTLGMPNYLRPVLFGYSAGAALVYATLAQAPTGLFAGGVSLGFCSEMDFSGARLCAGQGLHHQPLRHDGGTDNEVEMLPDPRLAGPWSIVHGDRDNVCSAAATKTFAGAIPAARLIALPQSGHDLGNADAWWPQLRRDYRSMQVAATPETLLDLPDLPVTEVPAGSSGGDVFAVMISGDGGWAGLDQSLTAALSARGIPTAGLNSLRYFWQARTPEETARDVDRMIEHYATLWHKARVMLIGYSFGADVMPAIFNRLTEQSRERVASINLLGLGPAATYEVRAGEWLPWASSKGAPVLPEIAKFGSTPTLCVDGEGERHTICPELSKLGIKVRQIGAGHHFSGRAPEIADAIVGNR
jgi:type IV secretory pathway VirJ component